MKKWTREWGFNGMVTSDWNNIVHMIAVYRL